ncbi:MAG: glycosyltransferase [Leptospiraceae bacterium]|nr:glycosyltransferase [Leptospiraceae bacterium]MCP5513720.1 glycosyltransferase [Leptospiraceae bacterium]
MKILIIIHGYPPEYNAGSEVYTQTISNALSKNHKIRIFTREEDPYRRDFELRTEILENGIQIDRVNKRIDKDRFSHPEVDSIFQKILDDFLPDLAHIGHLNHLSTGIPEVLQKNKIPIVYTLHDFWLLCPRGQFLQGNFGQEEFYKVCEKQIDRKCAENCYNHYFTGIPNRREEDISYWEGWVRSRMTETRKILDLVDIFLAPSYYLRNRFLESSSIPEEKIEYLDYGFSLNLNEPKKPVKEKVFTFGYIGTHIPAKGVNLLIEAFLKISLKSKLIIWGRNNLHFSNILKQMSKNSKYPIEFRGEYKNSDIFQEVFLNIDCIVVPSIWAENSPLVIHEAQAFSVPVITADTGGMSEYVQHGINGYLFEHRNSESLKSIMEEAIRNRIELEKLGKRGYLYSEDGTVPDIESHCKKLEYIYQKVIVG